MLALSEEIVSPPEGWDAHVVMIGKCSMASSGSYARAQNGVAYAITMVLENGLPGLLTSAMTVPSNPSWRPLHLKLRQDCYVDLDTWMIDASTIPVPHEPSW